MNKKKRNELVRKMITLFQLVTLIGLAVALLLNKMLPMKYLMVIIGGLFIIWAICFALQFTKKKVHLVGVVVSIVFSILQFTGVIYITMANNLMDEIGGAAVKVDNMVVVVREDDLAEQIQDTKDYNFGVQYIIDRENTEKTIDNINELLETSVSTMEYEGIPEVAQAMLDGEVDAVIYNEAYTAMIEEEIEDYSSKVRIIYQYEIATELEREEVDISKAFNIYISGIDVAGSISKNSRSDVNIIMTVNPDTKQILLTSTPRDFYVPIPGVSNGQRDKLTHAGIYGVDASMRTLEELYGIDIAYYARVNFTSLVRIVDALGGVDVESEYSFNAGGYSYKEGTNHLNGEQALAFARERKSFSEGDRQRGKNQEAVIEAILNKAMSPAVLTKATQIIGSLSDCVETNMTRAEMSEFSNMQLNDSVMWDIESQAADGAGSRAACYSSGSRQLYVMIPDETVMADVKQKMQDVIALTE